MSQRVLLVQSNAERYGSDRMARSLARWLPESGWDVVVTVPSPGPLLEDLRADGATVVVADPGVLRRVLTPAQWAWLAAVVLPRAIVRFRALARTVDVVHVNTSVSLGAALGARLAGRPVVLHVRESYAGSERLLRLYARLVRRIAAIVVAISEDVASELRAAGLGDRLVVIHDGIELPATPAPVRMPASSRWDVVCVSRINDWKGLDVLVDAVALLRDRELPLRVAIAGGVFPGGEHFRDELAAQIAHHGLDGAVELLGFVEDVDRLLAESEAFVLPSRRPEPFGLALVEAMASGLPCVATAAGGPRDIVEDGVTGLLVPPGDPVALAAALQRLRTEPDLATRLGAAARRAVRSRFSAATSAVTVAAVYGQVAPAAGTGRTGRTSRRFS